MEFNGTIWTFCLLWKKMFICSFQFCCSQMELFAISSFLCLWWLYMVFGKYCILLCSLMKLFDILVYDKTVPLVISNLLCNLMELYAISFILCVQWLKMVFRSFSILLRTLMELFDILFTMTKYLFVISNFFYENLMELSAISSFLLLFKMNKHGLRIICYIVYSLMEQYVNLFTMTKTFILVISNLLRNLMELFDISIFLCWQWQNIHFWSFSISLCNLLELFEDFVDYDKIFSFCHVQYFYLIWWHCLTVLFFDYND